MIIINKVITMFDKVNEYLEKELETAKEGLISIKKIKGENNERFLIGHEVYGYTNSFKEGLRCFITLPNHWFMTSMIQKIRWEDKEFDTIYSTYKFKFKENENSNIQG